MTASGFVAVNMATCAIIIWGHILYLLLKQRITSLAHLISFLFLNPCFCTLTSLTGQNLNISTCMQSLQQLQSTHICSQGKESPLLNLSNFICHCKCNLTIAVSSLNFYPTYSNYEENTITCSTKWGVFSRPLLASTHNCFPFVHLTDT